MPNFPTSLEYDLQHTYTETRGTSGLVNTGDFGSVVRSEEGQANYFRVLES